VVAGVAFDLYLWVAHPEVFWMWWNLAGFVVSMVVADLTSRLVWRAGAGDRTSEYVLWNTPLLTDERRWMGSHLGMLAYSAVMLGVCAQLPTWLAAG